jgi:CHAD domain-containing protein
MSEKGLSALALSAVIFRRTRGYVQARNGSVPGVWQDTIRALGRLCARMGAGGVDALAHDGTLTVSVKVSKAKLPEVPARIRAAVFEVTGLSLRFRAGEWVPQPKLDRREAAATGLGTVARWYLARIDALREDAMADRDPEIVHQIRVALRRLRCVLRVASIDGEPPWASAARAYVRTLGSVAGAVRDFDVGSELVVRLDVPSTAKKFVLERLAATRATALGAFRTTFEGDTLAQLRRALHATLEHPKLPQGRVRRAARIHFERELDGLERSLHGDFRCDEGYHEVRKRARRVRDAVDVLGRGLKRRERVWHKRLQGLQAHLGAFNDVAVALRLIVDDEEASRSVREALERRRVTLLAEMATPLALLAGQLDRRRRSVRA